MLGGSFPSRRLQPPVRCAVPAQLLAFRRFLFRAERLCHSRELPAAIARRFWRRTVSPSAAGQALSAAFFGVYAFYWLLAAGCPTENPFPGRALVAQPDSPFHRSPSSPGPDLRPSPADPNPPRIAFLD